LILVVLYSMISDTVYQRWCFSCNSIIPETCLLVSVYVKNGILVRILDTATYNFRCCLSLTSIGDATWEFLFKIWMSIGEVWNLVRLIHYGCPVTHEPFLLVLSFKSDLRYVLFLFTFLLIHLFRDCCYITMDPETPVSNLGNSSLCIPIKSTWLNALFLNFP